MNFDGLGECVTQLVAGEKIPVNVVGFSNDLDSFRDRDEVLYGSDSSGISEL